MLFGRRKIMERASPLLSELDENSTLLDKVVPCCCCAKNASHHDRRRKQVIGMLVIVGVLFTCSLIVLICGVVGAISNGTGPLTKNVSGTLVIFGGLGILGIGFAWFTNTMPLLLWIRFARRQT